MKGITKTRNFSGRAWLAALLLATGAVAQAAPISSSLVITGSVTLDTANSVATTGGASQSATLKKVVGGTTTTGSFSGNPASISANPLAATLTDLGDGFGAHFSMGGSFAGSAMTSDALFADYLLNLVNNSLTETFTITFHASIANAVSASGADAFAQSDISLKTASNVELLFSDHRIDTLNTGPGNNFTQEGGGNSFSVTLAPGQSASFNALQRQRGGVFAAGSYGADLNAFLFVDSVVGTGGPQPVPLPGSLPLAVLALGALSLSHLRRR
ncbi:MAG: hypothetical protein HY855_16560 [Burkholderiales bacterium]|nr:hypothetical protein [Burkholderiales bacterium]